jgi:hypothetical protein
MAASRLKMGADDGAHGFVESFSEASPECRVIDSGVGGLD